MKNRIGIIIIILILLSSSTFVVTGSSVTNYSEKSDDELDRYAVIMVGRFLGSIYDISVLHEKHYKWYLNDAARTYNMLKDTYGYRDDEIFLLVKTIPVLPMPESFEKIKHLIDYTSSKEKLELVLSKFEQGGELELGNEDSLLILMINHGGVYKDTIGNEGGISWLSPSRVEGASWSTIDDANDEDFYTYASYYEPHNGYSDSIKFCLDSPKKIRGFRLRANNYLNDINKNIFDHIQLSFNNGEIFNITYWPNAENFKESEQAWLYYRFEGEDNSLPIANNVSIRFNLSDASYDYGDSPAKIFEFDFWPSDAGYDMTKAYMGCPFLTIPSFLRHLYSESDTERLYDTELSNYVRNIEAKMIFLLQPCFSGAFIDDLSGENRIICTASRGNENADSWIGIFINALNKQYENVDENNDGKISILEAYDYTARKDYEQYKDAFHPLIDDDGQYPGYRYTESGYIKNGGSDGLLASQTFLDYEGSLKACAGGPYSSGPDESVEFVGSALGGKQPYLFSWDFNNDGVEDSSEQNPTYTFSENGDYEIVLTVTDSLGETDSDTAQVTVSKSRPRSFHQFLIEKLIEKFPFLSFIFRNYC